MLERFERLSAGFLILVKALGRADHGAIAEMHGTAPRPSEHDRAIPRKRQARSFSDARREPLRDTGRL